MKLDRDRGRRLVTGVVLLAALLLLASGTVQLLHDHAGDDGCTLCATTVQPALTPPPVGWSPLRARALRPGRPCLHVPRLLALVWATGPRAPPALDRSA